MNTTLNYDQLEQFKEYSLALRLLRSQHFALLASFFHHAFIATNRRSIPYLELVALLEQHLFNITDSYGEEKYPKSARAYIDDWINYPKVFIEIFIRRCTLSKVFYIVYDNDNFRLCSMVE